MQQNDKYKTAIASSPFGSISRLAEHLDLHYRNVESYGLLERRPVDRKGVVKHDIAAICTALECRLEDLFPEEFIDHPYRFRESYADGYGQRAKKVPVKRVFPERTLTTAQIEAVMSELLFARQIEPEIAEEFVLGIVQRLKPESYDALCAVLFDGKDDERSGKHYAKALEALNSPANFRKLQALKRQKAEALG